LCKIFEQIKRSPNIIPIWATTTPVNEKLHRVYKGFDRLETDVDSYNKVAVMVAKTDGALINDLFSVIVQAGGDVYLLPDGVHFNESGYALLGHAVSEFIKPILSSMYKDVKILNKDK
jgi:lysophospholipase L1-like esterase